jgi:hypothetical protein
MLCANCELFSLPSKNRFELSASLASADRMLDGLESEVKWQGLGGRNTGSA